MASAFELNSMGRTSLLLTLAAISTLVVAAATPQTQIRVVESFDRDWRFLHADASAAEQPAFDDSSWRVLNVPHDWSIEGPFDPQNPTRGAGAFLPAGIGWYRKHLALPPAYAQRRVFVDFDGVMANSDVWINGTHLGKRPYGYVSFRYELTGHLDFLNNQQNVLAVRVDNSQEPASRWYEGAGIYRHVRLVVTEPIHIDHWATFITTSKIGANQAVVHLQTTVVNQSNAARAVLIEITLLDPNGHPAANATTKPETVQPGQQAEFQHDLFLKTPAIWDVNHPALYSALVRVQSGRQTLDDEVTPFGVREFHFDPATGFWLNGKNFKLKGVCLHGDAGGLGTAVPIGAWERRLQLLRSLGVNAIRTAHNPPAPQFLDLCDRMGFLVMDEMFDCWTVAKNPYDYHLVFNEWSRVDTRDTVRRDRNHPSIILYSAGNEIHDTPKQELAKSILKTLVDTFHESDPTRPVTQALFRPNVSHDYDDGLADILDVVGQNYRENEILAAHAAVPTRKIVGTENGHDRKVWLALRDNAPYSGQFIWAGIDYLGESRNWPVIGSASGLLDRIGIPHPDALERQTWWSAQPVVHIVRRTRPDAAPPTDPGYEATPIQRGQTVFPDWTPRNSSPHEEDVEVYSNCQELELFLNGKSLGSQPLAADASPRTWRVPFELGTIRAIGTNGGRVVTSEELRTAGKPARVVLSADRATLTPDWDDVSYITATVVDENGIIVPNASDLITFKIAGPGAIAAVDNGNNSSHESFQASERHAYGGRCIAIVKANATSGRVIVSASAAGLSGSQASIEAVDVISTTGRKR